MNTDMLSNLCLIVLRLTIYSQTKMYSDTYNISHISTHLYSKMVIKCNYKSVDILLVLAILLLDSNTSAKYGHVKVSE